MTMKVQKIQIPLGNDRLGCIQIEHWANRLLGIDLVYSAFTLNEDGQQACQEILVRYARRFFDGGGKGSIHYNAGSEWIYISDLDRADREPCLDELLSVIYTSLVLAPTLAEIMEMEEIA